MTGTTAPAIPENVEEAWVDAGDSDAPPVFDRVAGNSTFAYDDENGHPHTVWLLDAASAFNELTMLDRAGIREVALWRLGAEDPGLWSIFGRTRHGAARARPGSSIWRRARMSTSKGPGEILRITALPTPGERRLTLGRNGLLANVDFVPVPRPFTITRTGYRPGVGRADLRRRAGSALDSADPRHPQGKSRFRRPSSSSARMR